MFWRGEKGRQRDSFFVVLFSVILYMGLAMSLVNKIHKVRSSFFETSAFMYDFWVLYMVSPTKLRKSESSSFQIG